MKCYRSQPQASSHVSNRYLRKHKTGEAVTVCVFVTMCLGIPQCVAEEKSPQTASWWQNGGWSANRSKYWCPPAFNQTFEFYFKYGYLNALSNTWVNIFCIASVWIQPIARQIRVPKPRLTVNQMRTGVISSNSTILFMFWKWNLLHSDMLIQQLTVEYVYFSF